MKLIGDEQPVFRLRIGKRDPETKKRSIKKYHMWDIIGVCLFLLLLIDCSGDVYSSYNPDPPYVVYKTNTVVKDSIVYVDKEVVRDSIIYKEKIVPVPTIVTQYKTVTEYVDREVIKDSLIYVDRVVYLTGEKRIDTVVTYPNRLYGYVSSSGLWWQNGEVGYSRSVVTAGLDYTIGKRWIIGGFLSKAKKQKYYYMNAKIGYKLFEH